MNLESDDWQEPSEDLICDCCGQKVERLTKRYWTKDDWICHACLSVWYDEGITNKAEIRRIVLARKEAVSGLLRSTKVVEKDKIIEILDGRLAPYEVLDAVAALVEDEDADV